MNPLSFIVLGTPGKSDMIWFYAAVLGALLLVLLLIWLVRLFFTWLAQKKNHPQIPNKTDGLNGEELEV